jgi:RNA polymerase sigma-70 factor (ECF subfamily)
VRNPRVWEEAARPRGLARAEPAADPDMLLRAVARGDETAFANLYDLVAGRVYGLARRVLRDPAQAEEVAPPCRPSRPGCGTG